MAHMEPQKHMRRVNGSVSLYLKAGTFTSSDLVIMEYGKAETANIYVTGGTFSNTGTI